MTQRSRWVAVEEGACGSFFLMLLFSEYLGKHRPSTEREWQGGGRGGGLKREVGHAGGKHSVSADWLEASSDGWKARPVHMEAVSVGPR